MTASKTMIAASVAALLATGLASTASAQSYRGGGNNWQGGQQAQSGRFQPGQDGQRGQNRGLQARNDFARGDLNRGDLNRGDRQQADFGRGRGGGDRDGFRPGPRHHHVGQGYGYGCSARYDQVRYGRYDDRRCDHGRGGDYRW